MHNPHYCDSFTAINLAFGADGLDPLGFRSHGPEKQRFIVSNHQRISNQTARVDGAQTQTAWTCWLSMTEFKPDRIRALQSRAPFRIRDSKLLTSQALEYPNKFLFFRLRTTVEQSSQDQGPYWVHKTLNLNWQKATPRAFSSVLWWKPCFRINIFCGLRMAGSSPWSLFVCGVETTKLGPLHKGDEFSVWALANRVIANKLRLRMAVSKKPSRSSKGPLCKFFRFVAWHMSLFLVPGIWEARDLLKLTLMLKLVTMLVMKLKCRSCPISPVRKMKNATSGEPLRCPAPCFSDCKPQSERGEN